MTTRRLCAQTTFFSSSSILHHTVLWSATMTKVDKEVVELRRLQSRPSEHETMTSKGGSQFAQAEPLGLAIKRRTIAQAVVPCLTRWLLTVAIVCALAGVLVSYANEPVMDKRSKKLFNTLITGLSIALGLAITNSLDDMIRDLRWCLVAQRHRSRRKVERILQADKISHLLRLAFTSHRLTIHVAVASWVILLLGSQVAVASLGLCYSLDAATGQALTVPGDILVADMSTIQTNRLLPSKSAELNAQEYSAHSYGIISAGFTVGTINALPQPGSIYAPGDPIIFLGNDTSSARYVFRETSAASAAEDGTNPLAVITARYISATTACRSARVISGGDGRGANITMAASPTDPSDPTTFTLPPQAANGGIDQTTYLVNMTQTCGPGCVPITAFEASLTSPWFYTCNVTVSPMMGATLPEHQVSDTVRVLSAAAIALQGVSTSSLSNDSAVSQFQSFPAEAFTGLTANGNVTAMGLLLSQFAIGTVAAVAESNAPLVVTGGTAPARGEALTVKHGGIIMAILIGAVVAQLIFEVAVATWAYRVAVPPDDVVAQAQVLRQLTAAAGYVREGGDEEQERGAGRLRGARTKSHGGVRGRSDEALWIYRVTPMGSSGLLDLHLEKRDLSRSQGKE
ncbi:hypothetical protein MN608_11209 [Microdochium nivale]|nr:hypothetical protein MN608_11209 [Microdochium nivale]